MWSAAPSPGHSDAELVVAARGSDAGAYRQLFDRWYGSCFDLAWHVVRDQEAAADLARAAFGVAWGHLAELRDPSGFGGWILRITRSQALHDLEAERRPGPAPDPGSLWELAACALGARDTSTLDLHLRHGLEPAELADEFQITTDQATGLLARLTEQLRETIGSALLWHAGVPRCAVLATVSPGRFDADAVTVIRRHQRRCGVCSAELRQYPDPGQLFAAVPSAVVPPRLRTSSAKALFGEVPAPARGNQARSGPADAVATLVTARPLLSAAVLVAAVLLGVACISL